MIFWSEINNDNMVLRSIRSKEENRPSWAKDTEESSWIFADLSVSYRGIAPVLGAIYIPEYDEFVRPKPYDSWIFDEEVFNWVPPIAHPDPDPFVAHLYGWNEGAGQWDFYGDKSNIKDGY